MSVGSGKGLTSSLILLVFLLWGTTVSCAASSTAAELPAAPYNIEPPPLTPIQCGQCHPSQYGDLSKAGGRHQFYCQGCHQIIHAYNPRKNNWAELMPNCSNCHVLPHGETFDDCSSCHPKPHSPLQVPSSDDLADLCIECHQEQPEALQKYPSAHSEVGCTECHAGRHGTIPSCLECHEPHFADQEPTSCGQCHPAHSPLQIAFAPDSGARTCGSCHETVYATWSKTPSRHGKVNCTICHDEHGLLPECTQCHENPHSAKLIAYYSNCLTCHLNPHNLPVKKKPVL